MILMCDKCYLLHHNQARTKSEQSAADYCPNCKSENYVANEKDIAIYFVDQTNPIDAHRMFLISGFELCLKLINTISYPSTIEQMKGSLAFNILQRKNKELSDLVEVLQRNNKMIKEDHDLFRDRSIKLKEELELKEHFNEEVLKDVRKKESTLQNTIEHLVASFNNYLTAQNI